MGADLGDRCVICGGEKAGIPIKEDIIFRTYRKIIHASRILVGKGELNKRKYRLVVCRDDYPKYKKMRSSYVRKEFTYVALGVVFTVLMLAVSSSKLLALAYGLVLTFFLYLLAQISYMPALYIPEEPRPGSGAAAQPSGVPKRNGRKRRKGPLANGRRK